MRFASTIIIALRALRRNVMRSVLTALGIIIGVAAVIATFSIGNGAKSQVEAQVASLGQNVVTVFSGSSTGGGTRGGWGSSASLAVEDYEAIVKEVPEVVAASPEVRDRNQVLANGLNWNTQVSGEGPDYPTIRSWPMAAGAMFTEQDVRSVAKVCVIGKTVADQLFPDQDPLGETIRVRDIPFKIIGQLGAKGFNLFGQDQDDIVLVPFTSHMKRLSKRIYLSSILVQAETAEAIPRVQKGITEILMERRRGREADFTVRNQVEVAEMATATSKTMTLLLAAVASVSLVVGGIGIMNIMLVSVTERTREIGIRLAVGAHGRDVLFQFLIEAIILSVLGGILGVIVGVGSSQLVSSLNNWPVLVSSSSILAAVSFSALVGIFFGFYPARKAASLDPIEALRYE